MQRIHITHFSLPARMNGMIVSATSEPSRATIACLYTDRRLSGPGFGLVLGRVEGSAEGAHDADGDGGPTQHGFRDAAQDQAAQPAAPVAGHHDEIGLVEPSRLDDG